MTGEKPTYSMFEHFTTKGTQLMDIYSILSSKPHNPHYLNRYITFIEQCQQKNIGHEGYVERHHICPKADDMFPEYKDFRQHSWNCAILTARQHFIAHIILERVFESPKTKEALFFMSNGKWKKYKNYSKRYERLRIEILPIWVEKGRQLGYMTTGQALVKDKDGNTFRIPVDDLRLKTGELVGHTKGMITAENSSGERIYVDINDQRVVSGEYQYISKNKVVTKNSLGEILYVRNDDPRYLSGELVGFTKNQVTVRNDMGETFNVDKNDERYLSGKYQHISTDYVVVKDSFGKTYKVKKDDPRYLSGELVGINAGYFIAKDKYGNKFRITNDDERYLSGDLIPLSKGIKHKLHKCLYCCVEASKSNITKWHNENCKLNPKNPNNSIGSFELIECPHCSFRPQTSKSNSRRNFKVNTIWIIAQIKPSLCHRQLPLHTYYNTLQNRTLLRL